MTIIVIIVNKKVQNAVHGCNLKNYRMISIYFQGKPFNITVIQVYAPTNNAEEAIEWFYEKCWTGRSKAGIKIAGRNINNLRYADDTTLMAESEELNNLSMKVKEESKKSWLKAQHSDN